MTYPEYIVAALSSGCEELYAESSQDNLEFVEEIYVESTNPHRQFVVERCVNNNLVVLMFVMSNVPIIGRRLEPLILLGDYDKFISKMRLKRIKTKQVTARKSSIEDLLNETEEEGR